MVCIRSMIIFICLTFLVLLCTNTSEARVVCRGVNCRERTFGKAPLGGARARGRMSSNSGCITIGNPNPALADISDPILTNSLGV